MSVDDVVLWRSVAATLDRVVAPGLSPGVELDTVVQLRGLAQYAATRPSDDSAQRAERLSRALNPRAVTHNLAAAQGEAARLLVAAQDPNSAASLRRRAAGVRLVLLDLLAADIAAAAPLMDGFAGHPAVDLEPQQRELPDAELTALTLWFSARFEAPVRIHAASVISGGHSRRMLRLSVTDQKGSRHHFVARIEQGGTFGTDGTLEAALMQELAVAGVPVAPVRWVEPSAGYLGHPFFVMDLVPGQSAVDDETLDAYVRSLHALHQLAPERVENALGPPPASAEDAVYHQIEHWSRIHHESAQAAVPLLEEAAEWLRRNLQPTGPVTVVHGDPGPGNFLVEDGRIRALTDWEFGHYGDAAEDWAYLAIRGRKLRDPKDWHSCFADLVGVRYDEEVWRSWEAFNSFKGACANLTALRLFREGIATTPNLLAIGTAVHFRFLKRLTELVSPEL
jgi:aminoglycoside phosphotransferase (APT) family kinase protein